MESVSCRLGSLHDVEAAKVRSVEDALHGVSDAFERLLRLLRRSTSLFIQNTLLICSFSILTLGKFIEMLLLKKKLMCMVIRMMVRYVVLKKKCVQNLKKKSNIQSFTCWASIAACCAKSCCCCCCCCCSNSFWRCWRSCSNLQKRKNLSNLHLLLTL